MNDRKTQWHPGFVAAVNLELKENRADLDYLKEFNLNTKPLEIDLLVIKKNPDVQIINEIGKLFRGHNLLEYKSPEDHMDIDTFYKSQAYACLYKAYGESVDARPADDITLTITRHAKPEGLFRYFKEHKVCVENPYPGIYYVLDAVLFQTQIVVGKELDKKSHAWIKALSGGLEMQELEGLLDRISHLKTKLDRELADSVLEVCISANKETAAKLKGDGTMCKALFELMEPEINKLVEERAQEKVDAAQKAAQEKVDAAQKETERAISNAITNAIRGYRDLGADNKRIQEILMRNYNLTQEEANAYL